MRHAAHVGDWTLVDLIARMLTGHPTPPSDPADRAYALLVLKLGLCRDGRNYHHG
jgi:hypothetical protein